MNKQQHYKAALYCRLSVDDGNYGGSASVSIETQKVLLEQYCNRLEKSESESQEEEETLILKM